jgi:hypothetical protein
MPVPFLTCRRYTEGGVTDHIWTIGELVAEALKGEDVSKPEPLKPTKRTRPGHNADQVAGDSGQQE